MSHKHGHDEDFLASYRRDGEQERAHQAKLVSAELRYERTAVARVSILALLGIAGGAFAGATIGGPVGMVVGGGAGGLIGRELGMALVKSEIKKSENKKFRSFSK
ncbi:MAG: hypothetical protein WC880_01345 [Candidatus Paceibacterota bacterium]